MENLEEDVKFIVDETFDFSVPSPSDSREEEEAAAAELVLPDRPPRRGLAHRSDLNTVAEEPQSLRISLGPLSPEKLEEILDEANRLAARLEQCALQERDVVGDGKGLRVKASPRRETFVIKDSPVRALLPTVNSSVRGTSSPGGLTPRLRSSEKKGTGRALRATSGKKPLGTKKEASPGNVFPTTRSQASPLSRTTPPARAKVTSSARVPAAGFASTIRPSPALQLPPNTLQRPSRTQGPSVRPSRLPMPTAIPKPSSQALLTSRSPLSGKGSMPPESAPPRKGPLRASTAGHRVPATQKSSLPVSAVSRSHLQSSKKVMRSGL